MRCLTQKERRKAEVTQMKNTFIAADVIYIDAWNKPILPDFTSEENETECKGSYNAKRSIGKVLSYVLTAAIGVGVCKIIDYYSK